MRHFYFIFFYAFTTTAFSQSYMNISLHCDRDCGSIESDDRTRLIAQIIEEDIEPLFAKSLVVYANLRMGMHNKTVQGSNQNSYEGWTADYWYDPSSDFLVWDWAKDGGVWTGGKLETLTVKRYGLSHKQFLAFANTLRTDLYYYHMVTPQLVLQGKQDFLNKLNAVDSVTFPYLEFNGSSFTSYSSNSSYARHWHLKDVIADTQNY